MNYERAFLTPKKTDFSKKNTFNVQAECYSVYV